MKPYNPLEKDNLGRSVTHSLINSEPIPLSAVRRFAGAGVYAIYYLGEFDAYAPIRKWNSDHNELHLPIYVGKAIPTGGEKGMCMLQFQQKEQPCFEDWMSTASPWRTPKI